MCHFGTVMPLAGLKKDELHYKPDNLEFVLRLDELGAPDLQDRTRALASMNAPMIIFYLRWRADEGEAIGA